MTQLSLKAELKIRDKKVRYEIHFEMKQLHMRVNLLLLHCKNISHEQKKQKLEFHMLLKEKIYRTIKLRTV